MPHKQSKFLMALVIALGFASPAHAVEIASDPGDYSPLPEGFDLGLIYLQHTEHEKFFVDGKRVPGDFGLTTDIGLLRYVHYVEWGGYTFDPQIILPFGQVDLDTSFGPLAPTSSSGVGDPIIGGTWWVHNDAENKRYVGLTGLLSLPLGEYDGDKGPINIGQNRWKAIFQAGYVGQITDDVGIDLIGEFTLYGENDDFLGLKKEQDPTYGIQTHLKYAVSKATTLALTYYHDFGGETELDGVKQDDELDNNSWKATVASFIAPDIQLMFQYGRSIDVENGAFEADRVNFRIVKVFTP